MMGENDRLGSFLTGSPRVLGVLCTLVLLLSQAGNVVAGNHTVISGP